MVNYRLNVYTNFNLIEAYPDLGFFVPSSSVENAECFGVYHYSGIVKIVDMVSSQEFYKVAGDFHNELQLRTDGEVRLEAVEQNTSFLYLTSKFPLSATKYTVSSKTFIEIGKGVLVVDGSIEVNENGSIFSANCLNYIKPREYAYSISGNATVLLIT